jgi:hypothetical protein
LGEPAQLLEHQAAVVERHRGEARARPALQQLPGFDEQPRRVAGAPRAGDPDRPIEECHPVLGTGVPILLASERDHPLGVKSHREQQEEDAEAGGDGAFCWRLGGHRDDLTSVHR